jgi:hypothetical protein
MRLTKPEQETVILFNEAENTATIDTCNSALIRQLDNLSEKHTVITETRKDQYSKAYIIPKSWVKIRSPRQLSEQQRRKLSETARHNFGRDKSPIQEGREANI